MVDGYVVNRGVDHDGAAVMRAIRHRSYDVSFSASSGAASEDDDETSSSSLQNLPEQRPLPVNSSNDNGIANHHEHNDSTDGIARAARIVQDLWVQITARDAPAVNEAVSMSSSLSSAPPLLMNHEHSSEVQPQQSASPQAMLPLPGVNPALKDDTTGHVLSAVVRDEIVPSLTTSSWETDLTSLYTTSLATTTTNTTADDVTTAAATVVTATARDVECAPSTMPLNIDPVNSSNTVLTTVREEDNFPQRGLLGDEAELVRQRRQQQQQQCIDAILASPSVTKLGQGPLAALCSSVWHQVSAHQNYGTSTLPQPVFQHFEQPIPEHATFAPNNDGTSMCSSCMMATGWSGSGGGGSGSIGTTAKTTSGTSTATSSVASRTSDKKLRTSRWYNRQTFKPPSPRKISPHQLRLRAAVESVGSFPSDEEEKKDDFGEQDMFATASTSAPPPTNVPPPPPPRLHQFGSEYARHLSNSQLAPTTRQHYHSIVSATASSAVAPSLRFPRPRQRRAAAATASRSRQQKQQQQKLRILEEAAADIQTGALLDVCITPMDDPPPAGYYRLSQTASGSDIPKTSSKKSGYSNNNNNSGPAYYHWNVKKEPVWDKAAQRPCVTAVTLIYPDRNEFVPPGFTVVRLIAHGMAAAAVFSQNLSPSQRELDHQQQQHQPANLNAGVPHAERIYLCLRRSREGNPITGLIPLIPAYGETVPVGYTVVERTPRNHSASITLQASLTGVAAAAHQTALSTTSGTATQMFLAYRQRLANLEPLRPLSLLQTIRNEPRLRAYYATGGTVVRSDVGRFHIMDRTTHSLLSPSSVANRLQVIEASRRRDREGNGLVSSGSYHSTTYARSDCESVGSNFSSSSMGSLSFPPFHPQTPQRRSVIGADQGDIGRSYSLADFPIQETVEDVPDCESECLTNADLMEDAPGNLSSLLAPLNSDDGHFNQVWNMNKLPICQQATSFIPDIVTASNHIETELDSHSRLEVRKQLLTPILTACYSRHGGSALVAVDGLNTLLTTTDFFAEDVDWLDENGLHSGWHVQIQGTTRLTLLDLAVQAVCDVATSGSQEILFPACVDFVGHAVSFAQGQLNTRTIGFVARFHMFVFYFDASIPVGSHQSRWPPPSWRPSEMQDDADFPMLYDPRGVNGDTGGGYLSGGAPQAAALALKELVSLSVIRLGKVLISETVNAGLQVATDQMSVSHSESTPESQHVYKSLMDSILSSLVDNVSDHVERADLTQLALHQIHRSGGSELFWNDMTLFCGLGLFAKDGKLGEVGMSMYALNFAILQHFVKLSSGKLRPKAEKPETLPRDFACKLLSLELLLHFLEFWSDEQEALTETGSPDDTIKGSRSIDTMAFAVRRTVVPCLLWNTRAGFENPQVFRRLIRILSELWCSPVYRKHCKLEIGVLIEHFALKLIELGPQFLVSFEEGQSNLLLQQIELIREIKNWFCGDPNDVIELYLNFDTDISSDSAAQSLLLPGTRWKIFQRMSAGISSIAELCGERIGHQIRLNQSMILAPVDKGGGPRTDGVCYKERAKRDVDSKEVREAARVLRKVSLDAMSQIVKNLAISASAASGAQFTELLLSWSHIEASTLFMSYPSESGSLLRPPSREDADGLESVKSPDVSSAKGGEGVLQFWKKAILEDKKQRASASAPTPEESLDTACAIAQQKGLRKAIEYLIACNSLTPAPRDIANFLRIHKDRFDPAAIGQYLSGSGSSGAEVEYWNSIRQLYVRATSFIGMHVEDGFRLPGEAQQIDRLVCTFAQCYFEDNAGDSYLCPFKNQDTVYLLVFAIIMLNTDLHKSDSTSRKPLRKMSKAEFTNNFKGAVQGDVVSKEYLSAIYDSIASHPIAMDEPKDATTSVESQNRSIKEILDNVRASDSMLRGLAVHDFAFVTINDFIDTLNSSEQHVLSDLSCSCVSKTWHQWHGLVNTCLDTAHLDPQGMEPAVDILLYALVVTICLDMPMERSAFLSQLVRLRAFEERRQGRWVSAPDNSHREEQWYLQLETACSGLNADKLRALRQIYGWIQSLKAALRVDVRSKVEMTDAVAELVDGDYLLDDPARSFLQSENLTKKSGRTGRSTTYRFYLFSDLLLYASKEPDGRYKIHEELPLHLMKIVDWFPPAQKNRKVLFEVHHPSKTFQVLCHSSDAKKSWVENIRASILVEMERKMTTEAARLSVSTAKAKCV